MTRRYYGTKLVTAWPQQGKNPESGCYEDGPDGYAVKYEDGYVSWSPKNVFERAYQPMDQLSFGHALCALKSGQKVARSGWNGKGKFLFLVPGSVFQVNRKPLLGIYPEGTEIQYHAHIYIKTADGMVVPWLASQTDVLADDWMVLE